MKVPMKLIKKNLGKNISHRNTILIYTKQKKDRVASKEISGKNGNVFHENRGIGDADWWGNVPKN